MNAYKFWRYYSVSGPHLACSISWLLLHRMSDHLPFSLLLYSNNILMIFLISSRFDNQFYSTPFILLFNDSSSLLSSWKSCDSSQNKTRDWTLRCIDLYVILLTTMKSIGNTSERKGKQNKTFYLKAFFLKKAWRWSKQLPDGWAFFKRGKITFTWIASKDFMNDILQSRHNATLKMQLENCIYTF